MGTTDVDIGSVTANTARALLHLRGDTASRALAELLVFRYNSLTDEERIDFFRLLLNEFGAVRPDVDAAIAAYQAEPNETNLVGLAEASDSQRLALFRAVNTAPGGIVMLLDMRSRLLTRRTSHPELSPVERDLKHLLSSWFNRGFLRLERLDWTTPAHILESLIKYEAVTRSADGLTCVVGSPLTVGPLGSSTRRCLTNQSSSSRSRSPRVLQHRSKT